MNMMDEKILGIVPEAQVDVFVAGMERTLRYQDIACLHEGDYFLVGKLYDSTGKPVPIKHEH